MQILYTQARIAISLPPSLSLSSDTLSDCPKNKKKKEKKRKAITNLPSPELVSFQTLAPLCHTHRQTDTSAHRTLRPSKKMSRVQTQAQHDARHGDFQRAKARLLRLFTAAKDNKMSDFMTSVGECAASITAGLAFKDRAHAQQVCQNSQTKQK